MGLAVAATTSFAAKPPNVTRGELALIPPYCIDTEGFSYGPENSPTMSPRARAWVGEMGRTFWSMHHYCWGLINLNRLRSGRSNAANPQYFAKQIVDEYYYVLNTATPEFVLLPEIWTRVGEAALLAGDVGAAMDAYGKARSIKPDYWPAYTQWADFLLSYNKIEEAKALVREGLRHAPESTALMHLWVRLGGRAGEAGQQPPPGPATAAPTKPSKPRIPARPASAASQAKAPSAPSSATGR
jgi:hypothetical protein